MIKKYNPAFKYLLTTGSRQAYGIVAAGIADINVPVSLLCRREAVDELLAGRAAGALLVCLTGSAAMIASCCAVGAEEFTVGAARLILLAGGRGVKLRRCATAWNYRRWQGVECPCCFVAAIVGAQIGCIVVAGDAFVGVAKDGTGVREGRFRAGVCRAVCWAYVCCGATTGGARIVPVEGMSSRNVRKLRIDDGEGDGILRHNLMPLLIS